MAIDLIAPDGSAVNTDPQHVESLLQEGYKPAGPSGQPAFAPVTLPQAPQGPVNLVAPDGSQVNADAEHVESLLQEGYSIAANEEVNAARELAANQTLDAKAITFAEGVGQGATLGGYGALANALEEGYGERLKARETANPLESTAGNVVGAVVPGMLSGGTGLAGTAARLTPAGQLAALSTKMGTMLSARATTALGRIGALAATGGAEGLVDNLTRTVMDDLAQGNVDITAERAAQAAWEGFAFGGAIGGSIGALAEGASAVGSLGRRLLGGAGEAADGLPSVGALGEAAPAPSALDDARPPPSPEPLPVEALGDIDPIKAQEARPLISSDMPDVDPGFLANVRASRGTYEESLNKGVKDITALSDEIQDHLDNIDEFAGIAAKRRLAETVTHGAPVVADDALAPVRFVQKELDNLTSKYSKGALKGKGGLGAIERVKSAIQDTTDFVSDALAKGEIGKANMALDDFKRIIGDAAGSKNNLLAGVFEKHYDVLKNALEDADVWGELATRQKPVNSSWWERIKRQSDQRIQGLFVKQSGEAAVNPFKRLTKTNDSSVNTLLQGLGDRGTAGQEEAFRRYLRSTVEDANTRARAWGTPELVDRAAKIREAATKIEQRMDETFQLKKAAGKWESQKKAVGEWTQSIPFLGALAKGGTWAAERAAGALPAPSALPVNPAQQMADETILALGKGAVKEEGKVRKAVETAMKRLEEGPRKAAPAIVAKTAGTKNVNSMVQQAQALQDPESPESKKLEAMTLTLAPESPEFADAIKAQVMKKATFIVSTLGPASDPGDPLGRQPMPVDPITKGRNDRFMRAAQDPAAALERLASGQGSAEDLAVVRELTPQLYQRWSDAVIEGIKTSRKVMPVADRQKWHRILGQPIERAQTPAYVQFYQQALAPQGQPQGAPAPGAPPAPSQAPGFKPGEFTVDNRGVNRTDDIMTPGSA
jgi:hypothetical protein